MQAMALTIDRTADTYTAPAHWRPTPEQLRDDGRAGDGPARAELYPGAEHAARIADQIERITRLFHGAKRVETRRRIGQSPRFVYIRQSDGARFIGYQAIADAYGIARESAANVRQACQHGCRFMGQHWARERITSQHAPRGLDKMDLFQQAEARCQPRQNQKNL